MIKIKQNLTLTNFTKKDNRKIEFLVIHYTGNNGDTAWGNTNYFKEEYRGASAHYFVDEENIYQCVLDKDEAWHCGTKGTYKHPRCRNHNSIGIELCSRRDKNNKYFFKDEVIQNGVELIKFLMDKYHIPIENIVRHYDVTGKICPEPLVDESAWKRFKAKISNTDKQTESMDQKIKVSRDGKIQTIDSLNIKGTLYVPIRTYEQSFGNVVGYEKGVITITSKK